MKRCLALALWMLPPLALIFLYSYSLRTWFLYDDFVWLWLGSGAGSFSDVLGALFTPTGHGTFRPISERGFFLLFHALFGLDALPFRLWVFATQIGNLLLLNALVKRLTGSAAAGCCAALLWVGHVRLVTALTWTSAYMQVLCGFFLLVELHLWLRYTETGRRSFQAALWAVFVLGFGVLETNLVFPALAAVHAFFFAPRYFRKALALFIPSALFVVLHMHFAPKQARGPYSLHFGPEVFRSLMQYWQWSVTPDDFLGSRLVPVWMWWFALWFTSAALAGFVGWNAWRRRWLPLVFLSWCLILLSPVLPLSEHVIEYYATLPVMALAMLGGWALVSAFRDASRMRWVWRGAGTVAAALFLLISVPSARVYSKNYFHLGLQVKRMVLGVVRARELHPGKTILLEGVDSNLFWGGVCDNAFRAAGVFDVYLAPGSEARIEGPVELCPPNQFVLSYQAVLAGLDRDKVVVYQAGGERLRNITRQYQPQEPGRGAAEAFRIDLASAAAEALLGPTWYDAALGQRWMPKTATVRLPVRLGAGQRLVLAGSCAGGQLDAGPLDLTVRLDQDLLGRVTIARLGAFQFDFAVPAGLAGREGATVTLEVSRTFRPPGETRDLGLVFGTLEVR